MNVELDELCEWCFENGRERPATSMVAGVPLCQSCASGTKQERFPEKKTSLYAPEAVITTPARSVPIPRKVNVPQVEKIIVHEATPETPAPVLVKPKPISIWDNHKPCACGCGSPVKKEDPNYLKGHEPQLKTKWDDCFKEISELRLGHSITVKMPEGGTRSKMNSALGMNALTKKWRWSLTAHRDGMVTATKIGDWASKDAERLATYEAMEPVRKTKPEVNDEVVTECEIRRRVVVLVPGAKPTTQVKITDEIARAIWKSLTLEQKVQLVDIEDMWESWGAELRMMTMSKTLLIHEDKL